MRTKLRSKVTLLFMTCALLIAVPAVAVIADQINVDGDILAPNNQGTVNLGDVNPGQTLTPQVSFQLNCNSNDHVNRNATVSLNYSAAGSTIPSGGSLSATNASISVPGTWPTDSTNCTGVANLNDDGNSQVTITAPKAPGAKSFVVTYNIVAPTDANGSTGIQGGTTRSVTYNMNVRNLPPTISSIDGAGSVTEGDQETYTINASDPNETSLSYSLIVVSGDATVVSGGATSTPTVKFNSPGDVVLRATVSDGVNAAVTAERTITVAPANTAPQLNLPGNITAEATSAAGAVVNYTASATDAEDDPDPTPQCSPASGSTFALGTTQVDCSVTDSGGLSANGSFNVTVEDTTGPVLDLPDDITAEATGPNGATVNFTASAEDAVDGPVSVECTPASGSTFALGNTEVSCSASDSRGNESTGTFNVLVQDTTAPSLTLPDNKSVEATGPNGAVVDFSGDVSATDLVDGPVSASCEPASGSTFSLGTTTVECSATDGAGNTASTSFTVTVVDTTGPVLTLPANLTTTATSNSAATVNFTATANDAVDGSRPVNCTPASGSSFPVGTTTVNCSSSDSRGNTSNGSFTVAVNYAFTGFFQPIDNNGVFNKAKIGSTVPVKFSLGGNQGLNIFAQGYPMVSKPITCGVNPSVDLVEEYAPTGTNSGLKYDATANQYIYNWKTDGYKAGECRQLIVKLADGSVRTASFNFFK